MDGAIIDIKRFTVHDGYGIRSTLFLKGCGLRCAWCHNPEGLSRQVNLWYLASQCITCGQCRGACPQGAVSLHPDDEPYVRIDRARCTRCGACVAACPTTALSFDGRILSAADAAAELLRDRDFYQTSGGGITISGGDPLVQHEFAREILRLCTQAGVHTAIQTCLQGDPEVLAGFVSVVDLFMVDLKIADPALHREFTGHDNRLILDNYRWLVSQGIDLITRIPLIPRITATTANVTAIGAFIAETNPHGRVELINFNPLAENKYGLMNQSRDFFRGMVPLGRDEMASLEAVLAGHGLEVLSADRGVIENRRPS